jgi:CDP-diglyceride synthetase
MATHYHMQQLANGLRVQAHQDWDRWQRLLVAAAAAIAIGFPAALYFGGWWWTILSIAAALLAFATAKGRDAELQITRVEFISKGDIGRRIRKCVVCTGDVRRLEFHEEGNPFSNTYGGLFAVTAHGKTCLLPMLDSQATVEVIRAIENKFPGLAEGWRSAT